MGTSAHFSVPLPNTIANSEKSSQAEVVWLAFGSKVGQHESER
jgi:hypothetical protein